MELTICHLYPDLLNLYGDRGNLITLAHRAGWRGIAARIEERGLGEPLTAGGYDLYFIGGGEDRQQRLAADDLRAGKAASLREAAAAGAVVLAVCGGYQLLGHYYRPSEGEDLPGVGLLDLVTEHPGPAAKRLIGNIVIRSPHLGDGTLVGFENHGGRTRLGRRASPLGHVVVGFGNNGEDSTEGAVEGTVYGTYLHGPLLPKNPRFADHLIETALRRRYGPVMLASLDDVLETQAHEAAIVRSAGR
jgi:CobQ-like glutamine amidotransferase family enzyme